MKFLIPIVLFVLTSTQVFGLDYLKSKRGVKKHIPLPAYYSSAQNLSKNTWAFELKGDFFNSNSKVTDTGEEVEYQDDEHFNRWQVSPKIKYALTENFQMEASLRYRSNSSGIVTDSNELIELTSSGIESYQAGIKYAFDRIGRWQVALEAATRQSAYSREEYNASNENLTMVLGDRDGQVFLGGHMSYLTPSKNYFNISTLYNLPTDFSSEVLFDVHYSVVGESLALILGVKGVYALANGPFSGDPASKPNMHTGNTQIYNGVDRQFYEPYVQLNWAFAQKWQLSFGGSVVQALNAYDNGYRGFGGITYFIPGTSPVKQKLKKFKTYSIEATVIKISPKGGFVKIDQGIASEVKKGMKFDIYENDYKGGNVLLATGRVYQVSADAAIVRIEKKYTSKNIQQGNVARASD